MKLLFSAVAVLMSTLSYAQPLIINNTDVPVPGGPFNYIEYYPLIPTAPPIGDSLSWDFSGCSGSAPFTQNFIIETDTFFTNSGVDVQIQKSKDLNSSSFYYVINKYDFDVNQVSETGVSIPLQGYDLSAVTGSTQDSLIFPAQKYHVTDPKVMMQFPMTANSSWNSVSRRHNNFELTVGSFSLNHTPGEHVYYEHRKDTIVGWGKMRVYTTTGPSIWYDVLMDKYEEYSIDSFYLNGAPAPLALLSAFSVTQGQKSNANYGYDFYRPGSFSYLVRVDFATDSLYSFILGTYQNIDNITAINEKSKPGYSVLLFPNPAISNELNIKITGKDFKNSIFTIMDVNGKIVQSGITDFNTSNLVTIKLSPELSNGIYFIKANTENGNNIFSESITINR